MIRLLPLILKNVRRNRRRTALTIGSIFVSLFLFTSLANVLATMERIEQRADSSHRICVHHKMSLAFTLPESYVGKLARLRGILAVCPFTWYGGYFRDPKDYFTTLTCEPKALLDVWGDTLQVDPDQWQRFRTSRTGALCGRVLADKFGWKVGDHVRLIGTFYPVNLEVEICAIPTKDFDPGALLVQRKYLEEALGNPGILTDIWCKVDRLDAIPELIQAIDDSFANSQYETLTETEKAITANLIGLFGDIKSVVGGIGLIVVLTIILVATNSMAMSVRERTTELAVLEAIGFGRTHVLALVLGESMLVSFTGGLLGCVSAWWLFRSPWLASMMGPLGVLFVARPSIISLGVAVALAVGAAAGFFPAVSAARLPIVDALRRVA